LLASALPAGGIPTAAISGGIDAVFAGQWPSAALWLCAVALRNGRRVVFGQHGGPDVTVGQAVAASCAVPGYFQPVTIGGRRYVDGGMGSLTNTDLLLDAGLDLVIISSPMTQTSGRPAIAADTLMRQPLRAQLHAEIGALRRSGVPVAVIEPDRQVAHAMGFNPMDARPRGAVSRVAKAATIRWLAERPEGQWLVAMLAVSAASTAAARSADAAATAAAAANASAGGPVAVASSAGPATVADDGTLLPSA
jgi:NTE family protein